MNRSKRIEKMLEPYGYLLAHKFFDAFNIYCFNDVYGLMPRNTKQNIRLTDGREVQFDREDTLYFPVEKDNPYGGNTVLVTFENTEEQLINKFERFIKMKAFL